MPQKQKAKEKKKRKQTNGNEMSRYYLWNVLQRELSTGEAWWFVGDETDALNLTVVVKSDDPDESVRVLRFAFLDFLQHLSRVSASEQGKLPHCPVTSIIVSGCASVLTVHKSMLYKHESTIHNKNSHGLIKDV